MSITLFCDNCRRVVIEAASGNEVISGITITNGFGGAYHFCTPLCAIVWLATRDLEERRASAEKEQAMRVMQGLVGGTRPRYRGDTGELVMEQPDGS